MKLLIATAVAATVLAGCAATPDTTTTPQAASSNTVPRHLRDKTTGSNIPRTDAEAQTYDRASVEREQARGAMGTSGDLPKPR